MDRGPAGSASEGNVTATVAESTSTVTATASDQSSGQNGGAQAATSTQSTKSTDPKGAAGADTNSSGSTQASAPASTAPVTANGAFLSPESLSELLTTAAKKHGRGLIAELLAGKRVADMTDAERNTVKLKVEALDAEKAGDEW
jgi:hypothetical protein